MNCNHELLRLTSTASPAGYTTESDPRWIWPWKQFGVSLNSQVTYRRRCDYRPGDEYNDIELWISEIILSYSFQYKNNFIWKQRNYFYKSLILLWRRIYDKVDKKKVWNFLDFLERNIILPLWCSILKYYIIKKIPQKCKKKITNFYPCSTSTAPSLAE